MTSLDDHVDNMLKKIDEELNQNVKQDEIVLAFTVGTYFSELDLSPCLPKSIKVTPSCENSARNSSPDETKPRLYLDCSGMRCGSQAQTDSTFTSLVILSKYLEKVKFVKVLIFVSYEMINPDQVPEHEICTQIKDWSSIIFSCPAIHLLNELPENLKMSFGLVVVQNLESEPSENKFQEIRNVEEIRNACYDRASFIWNLTGTDSPELKLYFDFVRLVGGNGINLQIVFRQLKYNGDDILASLVNLKSSSGIKILKFHQQVLCATNKISGKDFLLVLKKTLDGQHFDSVSSRLRNQLIYKINQLIPSALKSIQEQYSDDIRSPPNDSPSSISRIVEIDRQQGRVNCKTFNKTVEKEILPKSAACLQNQSQEVRDVGQSVYQTATKINTFKTSSQTTTKSRVNEMVKLSQADIDFQVISRNLLQITGNLVKFSDLINHNYRSILKQDYVFATQRIVVDQDYYIDNLSREFEITLVAPSIEIIGKRVISLEGKPGENNFSSSSKNGKKYGQDGKNGLPGKAGGNGGHLYLICEEIINASGLTVNVRGGNGGNGQNGGNGCDGAIGRSATASDLSKGQTEKEGFRGQSGGNGGDGGAGGYPGHGGSVEIVVLKKQDGCVKVFNKAGQKGKGGKGGSGGTGGLNGNGIRRIRGLFGTKDKLIPCWSYAPAGKPGKDGANSINQELPPPKKSQPDSKATVISELRKFYMSQSDAGDLSVTRLFLERIESKLECQNLSVESLANDLLQLEVSSRNVHDPKSLIRDHEAIQSRILRYVSLKMSEKISIKEDFKRVIKLLYAQSISKVLVLKENRCGQGPNASGAQVINILGYFDIIKETITRLKESSVEITRREALKTYHDHLKAKCDDTKDFISRIVLPSIAQAKREIQEEIRCCAGEVECYGKLVEEDLRSRCSTVVRASSKVHVWNIIKTVFTVLELGIGVAQWLNGPIFAVKALMGIAGFQKLIGTDTDENDDRKTCKSFMKKPSIQLPYCLNDFHGTMEHKMRRMRKECELVNGFLEALDKHSSGRNHVFTMKIRSSLEGWQAQLTNFQGLLNLMKVKKSTFGTQFKNLVAGMENSKTEILKILENMLEMKLPNLSYDELIGKIKRLLVDMWVTNCDSNITKQLPLLASTPVEVIPQDQFQIIQEKYAAIFEDIMPLINAALETVAPSSSEAQDSLVTDNSSSSESRQFDKWRIQTTLRKLKEDLTSFFNGLESKTSLMQAVQQMEEGLSVLIDLYDMMDSYEESKLFSSALAGIKLSSNNEDSVELQATVDKIGYLLKANTFILDYNQAVHAFKQWIFPFANKCPIPNLNFETDLTRDLDNCENHLEKLATEYKSHFDTIHGHLLRYRSMKMDFDYVIFRGMYSSNSSACPPFYVWKWEEWGNMITRLLNGEEVEFRADLMSAEQFIQRKMGAVKFKTVQLKIRPKNGLLTRNLEVELDKIMKLFKVTLVHSGISYYKVFDQCFVMRGSRNEYCYSFDGATKNSTYEKSESQGDYLLSPFTLWKFQLNEIMDGAGGFEKLAKFEGQVDLELWGDGMYLDEGKAKQKRLDEKYLKDLHLHYELI